MPHQPLKVTHTVLIFVCAALSHAVGQVPFFDDFNGSSLDTTKWTVLAGSVQVSGGLLRSSGDGHKRIDSIPTFGNNNITATASISVSGRYQKFGFRVNSTEFPGTNGYYFDTLGDISTGQDLSVPNFIYAQAWAGPVQTLNASVPASWGQFHNFTIMRTPTTVTFLIDAQQVAQVSDTFAGALPVGIWNDRPELILTDSVKVSGCQVNASDVNPFAGEPDSLDGHPTSMNAAFTPPSGLSLTDFATACGFTGFDWVQLIDQWPSPSGLFAMSASTVPITLPPPPWP